MTLVDRLADLRRAHAERDGRDLLEGILADRLFAGRTALVSSFGAESAVLLHMVAEIDPAVPVICLETGKLFEGTRAYREELTARLGLKDVRVFGPDAAALRESDHDGRLWQREPDFCCYLRKTEPLERALDGFAAWITGRKRFQGGLRQDLPVIEGEIATGRIKLNPLAPWPPEAVEAYRRAKGLPEHPLVAEGYASIGCVPCTRPVASNEAPRAGRWWGLDKTECGIHRPGI